MQMLCLPKKQKTKALCKRKELSDPHEIKPDIVCVRKEKWSKHHPEKVSGVAEGNWWKGLYITLYSSKENHSWPTFSHCKLHGEKGESLGCLRMDIKNYKEFLSGPPVILCVYFDASTTPPGGKQMLYVCTCLTIHCTTNGQICNTPQIKTSGYNIITSALRILLINVF